jgi:hypothetical protein
MGKGSSTMKSERTVTVYFSIVYDVKLWYFPSRLLLAGKGRLPFPREIRSNYPDLQIFTDSAAALL